MKPVTVVIDLLDRLAAGRGDAVLVSDYDLGQWPPDVVVALKSQKLIIKARASTSAVCPGCERECAMPVEILPTTTRSPIAFIVCDKRSDTNRVPVPLDRLTQWQCSTQAVCGFVVNAVGMRSAIKQTNDADVWEIGVATGKKRSQMLCLQTKGALVLVAGGNALPLADFIGYANGAFLLNAVMVQQLVDTATTADPRYTPSTVKREARKFDTQAMYTAWQKAYRASKRNHPDKSDVWHSQQIAKTSVAQGRDASTIKKNMLP
ncbi:hypothetical protein RCH06_003019 [Polaromonas sp. CG_9.5]|uniref:hypothetical protein n=1 Tax=Polaromonas sp. CG_9.5 TaxID=3071705 RepID=UPI002DFD0CE3|nr:hypothetical protein [Polaromonas sp. CG_9.5]